ncbi:hypothetical protein Hc94105_0261 [Helicobacter cinaedi]|uniref:class I SAM-dependent methyltransferase n=1 Tax=Helicobacter cinaedi TaxID=213 RepID=UPI001F1B32CA|nr:DUF4942 domain-containing protein [Helicobacter cinaedi]BDB66076.1 hypothetical protein Hc94105_0261 [Helicobacter cinaedi]
MSKANTIRIVNECKSQGQDFEFYPTTDEILSCLVDYFNKQDIDYQKDGIRMDSILDLGAGDGRVLEYLEKHINQVDKWRNETLKPRTFYAMEKSQPLIKVLSNPSKNITLLGTDILEATLIDKRVDLVFCNPPYSQFELFTKKILQEANAHCIALVIPQRWKENLELQAIIKDRELKLEILGSFDFKEADREARANVELLLFTNNKREDVQFSQWLKSHFHLDNVIDGYRSMYYEKEKQDREERISQALVKHDLVAALLNEYNAEMNKLAKSLEALSCVDKALLMDLNIDRNKLLESIKFKLKHIKNIYWAEIFDKLDSIRDRFTTHYKKAICESVVAENHIDFTRGNIYMILIWLIENANNYIKRGMEGLFDSFSERGNAMEYKSNQRWRKDEWRYTKEQFDNEPRKLDYRIVLTSFEWKELLNDIRAVALQLGFNVPSTFLPHIRKPHSTYWDDDGFYGNTHTMYYKGDSTEILCEFKPYKNGNIHIKFNKDFFAKFNIAVGKGRGWIKDKSEAKAEFKGVSDALIDEAFVASNGLSIAYSNPFALLEQ